MPFIFNIANNFTMNQSIFRLQKNSQKNKAASVYLRQPKITDFSETFAVFYFSARLDIRFFLYALGEQPVFL